MHPCHQALVIGYYFQGRGQYIYVKKLLMEWIHLYPSMESKADEEAYVAKVHNFKWTETRNRDFTPDLIISQN